MRTHTGKIAGGEKVTKEMKGVASSLHAALFTKFRNTQLNKREFFPKASLEGSLKRIASVPFGNREWNPKCQTLERNLVKENFRSFPSKHTLSDFQVDISFSSSHGAI